mgnify:CR=1 FL=1
MREMPTTPKRTLAWRPYGADKFRDYVVSLTVVLCLGALPHTAWGGEAVVLSVGVVADVNTGQVYIPSQGQSGLRALETTGGTTVWVNPEATVPLTITDDQVVAKARGATGSLAILGLNATTGATIQRCEGSVPEWLQTTLGHSHGHTFSLWAIEHEPGVVDVHWAGQTWWAEGPDPGPQGQAAARNDDSGSFRCDLSTGTVVSLQEGLLSAPLAPEDVLVGESMLRIGSGPIVAPPADRVFPAVGAHSEQQRVLQALLDNSVVWDVPLPQLVPGIGAPD